MKISKNIFPGVYGLLNYFTIRLLQDTESGYHFWRRPALTTTAEICTSFLVGYVFLFVVNRLCQYTDSRMAGKLSPAVLLKEFLHLIVLNALIVNAILTPFTALTDDGLSLNDLVILNVIPLLYTSIYYGGIRSNMYLRAYVENQLLVEKLTNDKLDTELKFLKAQYHPHFLFNALNTIYFRMDDDVPGAKRNLEQLSELLRYQLYDQQQQVAVKNEMDYLRNYIELQKTRMNDKLAITIAIDEQMLEQRIYPLLFLPLVENAFKYVGGDYQLGISAQRKTGGLFFIVTNTVNGIAPADSDKNNSGIGLENLNRRLQLLYPGKHTLQTGSTRGVYTAQLELTY